MKTEPKDVSLFEFRDFIFDLKSKPNFKVCLKEHTYTVIDRRELSVIEVQALMPLKKMLKLSWKAAGEFADAKIHPIGDGKLDDEELNTARESLGNVLIAC